MDRLTVTVRFLLYLDLMVLLGVAAFGLYGLRGGERVSGAALPFTGVLLTTALGGIVLSCLGLAALVAGLSGTAPFAPDTATLTILLEETSLGTGWLVRTVALAIAGGAAFALRRQSSALSGLSAAVLAGSVATATLAWAGHGAINEGAFGWLHLGADIIHLLAAAIWVGALLALALLVFRPRDRIDRAHLLLSHRTLAGFSTTGTIVVAALLVSGLVNLLGVVGWQGIAGVPATLYGQLLLAKLVLFLAMLGLAASNRFRLVPAFEAAMEQDDLGSALGSLRRSLVIESGCVIVILALVAWLGTLDPTGAG